MDTKTAARGTTAAAASTIPDPVGFFMSEAPRADLDELKPIRNSAKKALMLQIGQRCKLARGQQEIQVVADAIGVHRNTIWNIERGESLPDAFELGVMARLYNTTEHYLLTGEGVAKGVALGIARSTRAVHIGDYIYVPHFDIQVSAGAGSLFTQIETVKAMRPFDEAYIRIELGIKHNDIVLTDVTGNSMEPKLHSRDTTMVDLRSREALTEGVHVIRMDGALLVKKVQRLPGRVLRITSENSAYAPFDIHANEDSQSDFEIIGKVTWAGVTIK